MLKMESEFRYEIWSLIFGLLSLLVSFFYFVLEFLTFSGNFNLNLMTNFLYIFVYFGWLSPVLAVRFGLRSRKWEDSRAKGEIGLGFGIISFMVWIYFLIIFFIILYTFPAPFTPQ